MSTLMPIPSAKESASLGSEPLADPRTQPGFELQYYPRVNGEDAPSPTAVEQNDSIKRKFAAAYYALNCRHAQLKAVRSRPDSTQRREEEKKLLQEIERRLISRDQLEDEYAPFGVIAEPVLHEGFTVDLKISFGNVDAFGRLRTDCYTISACVPIPLPGEINFDELPITIEGPGIQPPMNPFTAPDRCEN